MGWLWKVCILQSHPANLFGDNRADFGREVVYFVYDFSSGNWIRYSSVVFRVKIPPLLLDVAKQGGDFYQKSPDPRYPIFSRCGGLQKLVLGVFTFCSPPQAEKIVILHFRNTISLKKIDVFTTKIPKFSPPAEPLRQIPKCCDTRGGFLWRGGVLLEIGLSLNGPDSAAVL